MTIEESNPKNSSESDPNAKLQEREPGMRIANSYYYQVV